MSNAIIHQGYFTSDGTDKLIALRSKPDWVQVYNLTNIAGATQWAGTQWYWEYPLANDDAITWYHAAASQALSQSTCAIGYNGATYHGISIIDTSDQTPNAINATITAVSNATPPLVSATDTTGVTEGCIVRMINVTGAQQLGGIDFTADTVTLNTSFELAYAPTIVAGTTGSFRVIPFDKRYYPRTRYISAITQAASAVVTMTVTHGYTVGQAVRLTVPAAYGMVEMNGLVGTITAISTANNTITVDIDSSAFTAFAFPLTAAVPFSPAIVSPVGEDVSYTNTLDDAVYNTGEIIMKLGTSATAGIALGSAGGSNGDAIKWIAGKSFNIIAG